jgi:hypothetical protein
VERRLVVEKSVERAKFTVDLRQVGLFLDRDVKEGARVASSGCTGCNGRVPLELALFFHKRQTGIYTTAAGQGRDAGG